MKNNKQKLTHSQQLNFNQMPQIQSLNLEQLDSVSGGEGIRNNNWRDYRVSVDSIE